MERKKDTAAKFLVSGLTGVYIALVYAFVRHLAHGDLTHLQRTLLGLAFAGFIALGMLFERVQRPPK